MLALLTLLACREPIPPAPSHEVAEQPSAFTIAVLPDTQFYTLGYPDLLQDMMRWILENQESRNIAFVVQEGDLTHNNTADEWIAADAAFAMLDGEIPYAVCVGNHDMIGDTNLYNEWFGLERFGAVATWQDSMSSTDNDNHFHLFSAGGTDWLVMSLSYAPDAVALEWASEIVADHPSHRVIVLTHAYLAPDATLSSVGEQIWSGLVRAHPNMTFVLNGHFTGGHHARRESLGDGGNTVYELFVNYQTLSFGGLGQLRLLKIDPNAGTIDVETCSAWDTCLDDDESRFSYTDADLGPL